MDALDFICPFVVGILFSLVSSNIKYRKRLKERKEDYVCILDQIAKDDFKLYIVFIFLFALIYFIK